MSMEEHIVDLMRDQFRTLHEKVDNMHDVLKEHAETDQRYWAKIDKQEGQLGLLKWLTAPGIAGFFTWLYNQLSKH